MPFATFLAYDRTAKLLIHDQPRQPLKLGTLPEYASKPSFEDSTEIIWNFDRSAQVCEGWYPFLARVGRPHIGMSEWRSGPATAVHWPSGPEATSAVRTRFAPAVIHRLAPVSPGGGLALLTKCSPGCARVG
jgi:hypothetical protein